MVDSMQLHHYFCFRYTFGKIIGNSKLTKISNHKGERFCSLISIQKQYLPLKINPYELHGEGHIKSGILLAIISFNRIGKFGISSAASE